MQIDSIIHPLNLGKSNFQFLHPASDLNHVSAAIFHINCLKKSIDVGVSLDLHTVGPQAWRVFIRVDQKSDGVSILNCEVCKYKSDYFPFMSF